MAAGFLGKFIVIAIIASILIIWGYHFINKQFHIFAKYELIALGFNIASLYLFFKTMQDALSVNSFMSELDVWMNLFILEKVNIFGFIFMNIITDVFSPEGLLCITFVCLAYFIYKKQWRYSIITAVSTGGGLFISAFIKELIMRARPLNSLVIETGYSFPSNHAVIVTVFFILIIYFFAKKIKSLLYREIIILTSVFVVILTAFSRIYLGVHWLSDVVAGISLGLFFTTLVILFVKYASMIVNKFSERNQSI
jgi:membrane-associated phospholipid phosphatase